MRALLVGRSTLRAAVSCGLTAFAIVRVGADKHPAALVVGHDLVEIGILGPAQRTRRIELVARERMVLEVQRDHRGIWRNGVDALLASGAKQLERRAIVH